MNSKKKIITLSIITIVVVLLFLLIGLNERNFQYAISRRIPKIIAMILTGAAIGVSSLIFQTITNNRILTPSILGFDSLYVLLQTSLIYILGSSNNISSNSNLNFVISVMIMVVFSTIIYKYIFKKANNNIFTLLLIGVVGGTFFESLTTFMQVVMDPLEFQFVQDKMMSSFNNINTNILLLSTIVIIITFAYCYDAIKVLDVMSLGRDEAINLGVDYDKMVKKMLIIVTVLTSVSTALVGPITFLGLLVVNIARQLINTFRHGELSLASILISVIALVGGQLFIEQVMNFGITLTVVINFVGGIYFIYLIMKERG